MQLFSKGRGAFVWKSLHNTLNGRIVLNAMAVHECVSGQLKQIDPYIIPQCPPGRRSYLRTVGVHNTSPTTVQTYDDEAGHDLLSSPTCEFSHHAKLMVPFWWQPILSDIFWQSINKGGTNSDWRWSQSRAVKRAGRYRPLHRARWADCRKGIPKVGQPFPFLRYCHC